MEVCEAAGCRLCKHDHRPHVQNGLGQVLSEGAPVVVLCNEVVSEVAVGMSVVRGEESEEVRVVHVGDLEGGGGRGRGEGEGGIVNY